MLVAVLAIRNGKVGDFGDLKIKLPHACQIDFICLCELAAHTESYRVT